MCALPLPQNTPMCKTGWKYGLAASQEEKVLNKHEHSCPYKHEQSLALARNLLISLISDALTLRSKKSDFLIFLIRLLVIVRKLSSNMLRNKN